MDRKRCLNAAKDGQVEVVSSIIDEAKKKAPPLNNVAYDMLSVASANNQISIVEKILSEGINVDGWNHSGQTSLYKACKSRHADWKIVKFLLDKGADVNKEVKGGWTPLAAACHYGKLEVINLLIEHGASLHWKTSEGNTPLAIAVYKKRVEVCLLLLRRGAEVDGTTKGGFSPLMISAQQGNTEISRILLGFGAHLKKRNDLGFTPLMLAAQNGHVKLVEIFLSQSIDCLYDSNDRGFTSLMLASDKGHLDTVRLLLSHMDGGNNSSSQTGVGVLMLAVNSGHKHVVQYLLDCREFLVNQADYQGVAALHLSAQSGDWEMSSLLLNYGATVDQRTSTGATPLMVASSNGHTTIAKLLINHGAQLDIIMNEENGFAALDWAVSQGHLVTVQSLLEAGASVTKNATALAEGFGNIEMVESLKEEDIKRPKIEHEAKRSASQNVPEASINYMVRETESQTSVSTNLGAFKAMKYQEMKKDEANSKITVTNVPTQTNTLPCKISFAQPKSIVTQKHEKEANLIGGDATFPSVRTVNVSTVTSPGASSTQPNLSVAEGPKEKTKAFTTETSNGRSNEKFDQTRMSVAEKQARGVSVLPSVITTKTVFTPNVSLPQPLSSVPEQQKEASKVLRTNIASSSTISHPRHTMARGATSVDSTPSTRDFSKDSTAMTHSSSAPAKMSELHELVQHLSSDPQRPPLILIHGYVDKRTINISDVDTVGLDQVNIFDHSRKGPEKPDDDDEDEEEGGED
ncbi:ankyrin repeat-containing domain [Elysia marginata]|uniref:Ankyrin repeat-containing domain n=1 Tax=Elysia marginata TaxID=1093978 RepID=A0AAV4FSV6_9GAST|nr:ankyrin repeat-containing domain [Elysia marginata]